MKQYQRSLRYRLQALQRRTQNDRLDLHTPGMQRDRAKNGVLKRKRKATPANPSRRHGGHHHSPKSHKKDPKGSILGGENSGLATASSTFPPDVNGSQTDCPSNATRDTDADIPHVKSGSEGGHTSEGYIKNGVRESVAGDGVLHSNFVWRRDEEPEDYTDGPPRVIMAHDGLRTCGALLLNMDLTSKVRAALLAQRRYNQNKELFLQQDLSDFDLDNQVWGQIAHHNLEISTLRKKNDASSEQLPRKTLGLLGEDVSEVGELEKLEYEVKMMKGMREELRIAIESRKTHLHCELKDLQSTQARANALLEDSWLVANLIEPEGDKSKPEISKKSIADEFAKYCKKINDPDYYRMPQELTEVTPEAFRKIQPTYTPSEIVANNIRDEFKEALRNLERAQREFAAREKARAIGLDELCDAGDRGEEWALNMSTEDFDVTWLANFREMTRRLVEAEAAFDKAKKAACEAGIRCDAPILTSDFVDRSSDGGSIETEGMVEMYNELNGPRITEWMDDFPEGWLSAKEAGEPDEKGSDGMYGQLDDVDTSDSVSARAHNRDRRWIDKWQARCNEERAE